MRGWFLFSFDKFELIGFDIPVFLSTERYCVASLKVAIDAVAALAVTNFLVARLFEFLFKLINFHRLCLLFREESFSRRTNRALFSSTRLL